MKITNFVNHKSFFHDFLEGRHFLNHLSDSLARSGVAEFLFLGGSPFSEMSPTPLSPFSWPLSSGSNLMSTSTIAWYYNMGGMRLGNVHCYLI